MVSRTVDAWGRVHFKGEDAMELLLAGHRLQDLLIEPSEETQRYNELCIARNKEEFAIPAITQPDRSPAEELAQRRSTWLIPAEYRELPVRQMMLDRCETELEIARVNQEMDLFEQRGWVPVLRLMLYLVDHFRENGVVWGVGRGSSVASYVLFLIGVHRINSLAFELDIREFLK